MVSNQTPKFMNKVLVTSGAGFIGIQVAEQLVSRDDQIMVLDDLSDWFRENITP
jgi:UDP-glucose 4-epimerase